MKTATMVVVTGRMAKNPATGQYASKGQPGRFDLTQTDVRVVVCRGERSSFFCWTYLVYWTPHFRMKSKFIYRVARFGV